MFHNEVDLTGVWSFGLSLKSNQKESRKKLYTETEWKAALNTKAFKQTVQPEPILWKHINSAANCLYIIICTIWGVYWMIMEINANAAIWKVCQSHVTFDVMRQRGSKQMFSNEPKTVYPLQDHTFDFPL